MFRLYKTTVIVLVVSMLPSCASWWSSESSNEPDNSSGATAEVDSSSQKASLPAPLTGRDSKPDVLEEKEIRAERQMSGDSDLADQLGLSQARIIERMREIEVELRRQREQIKLLERGLITGIPPSDLKSVANSEKTIKGEFSESASNTSSDITDEDVVEKSSTLPAPMLDAATLTVAGSDRGQSDESSGESLELALAQAKKIYQSGDFSKALVAFAKISREFGENVSDGVLRYWFGKCYLGSKDYNTAKSEFEIYLTLATTGAHMADARLELGRTLAHLGLKERARTEFRKVIKDFDGQEPAQIAVYELTAMQGAL